MTEHGAQRTEASAHTGHLESLPPKLTTPLIERMIRVLVPSGRYAEIVALFEARVPYSCIKEWRRGRVKAPVWALKICADRLAPIAEIVAQARSATPSLGYAPNILAWHARQKEKAGNKAGPSSDQQ